MIIWESFHWPGKYPVLKTLLNIWVISLIPISGYSCTIFSVIRSCSGAFFERNCFIADRTSGSVNFLSLTEMSTRNISWGVKAAGA